jgi:hypothetical protein
MSDDGLGDPAGPNVLGLYLNGVGLGLAGGDFTTAQRVIFDVTALLHCGQNRLYVYNRDRGCSVSGANFSATINYMECITPVAPKSWGAVRALYR